MNLPRFRILFTLAALVAAGCAAPGRTTADGPDPAHAARNALDWPGTYRGTLPCPDCPGIETTVTLLPDGTYRSRARHLGGPGDGAAEQGGFTWNEAGDQITLAGRERARYFVAENRLIRLGENGSPSSAGGEDRNVLAKVTDGITERYWKLVELNGRPVRTLEREPYFILKAESGRVTGFGGCNGFGGTYEVTPEASRIRFDQIVSTMMACPKGTEVERDFHAALRKADSYVLAEDSLALNRARMAPLARFEAVYLH